MALPPGPTFLPPLVTVIPWLYRPFAMLDALARHYPDAFTWNLPRLENAVVFYHPDAIKEIFSLGPDDAHAGKINAVLGPLLGQHSLLLLDGAEHIRQRKLLLPPLHGERMASYGERIVRLTESAIQSWPDGGKFPIHPELQRIALDIILRVIFGVEDGENMAQMHAHVSELLDVGANPLLLFPGFQRDIGPFSPWGKFVRMRDKADELIYDLMRRRRESKEKRDDILSLLLEARDEEGRPMPDVELRDELVTLLVAGHETTATALSWALRWLLDSPMLTSRLLADLENEGALTNLAPDRIARAPLLDAVIRETLRLQPVVPMVGRVLQRPMRIGGYDLEAGRAVIASVYLVQRRPDLYPDPARFDPDRFLRRKFGPNEWLPFGGGIRRCIGMAFALYEMKMVLATILARTVLRLPRFGKVREVRRSITISTSDGMPVVLERKVDLHTMQAGLS
ncbi:MAG: cytochrome P450 [Polyangiaceae bacterium]|nr:cytochrome P450 [Polyangiaceae bacterium]